MERLVKDDDVQKRIIKYNKLFWEKIFLPEHFIMTVLRELLPIVL